MSSRLYRTVQFISTRAVTDIAKVQFTVARLGAWLLDRIDGKRLAYEVALVEQQGMINEFRILEQTVKVKEFAMQTGGFDHEHGPMLAMAANALQDACDWDEESVLEWFSALVLDDDGENLGADIEIEEE